MFYEIQPVLYTQSPLGLTTWKLVALLQARMQLVVTTKSRPSFEEHFMNTLIFTDSQLEGS